MATLTFDGQSFILDGRRIWLVSGAMHYPRTPRALWRKRLQAAKQAGINCIETYAFWNAHEPEPGNFDFSGDLDLRAFVKMVGEEGMFCIVRPGPFVCSEWDFGGLPAWLKRQRDNTGQTPRLRQHDPRFLEATSRYLGAVMEQIADLQITAPVPGRTPSQPAGNVSGAAAGGFYGQGAGPIILVQAENEWFSNNPEQHDSYLRELVRYLRENGCEVPIINCNNLWQRIEGTIDCWNGTRHLATDVRQLGQIQPEAPRLVTEYWPGWFDQWGSEHCTRVSPDLHLYRMAGILSSGGQPNLYMFHGGTNFGFWGGRTVNTSFCFMTTSYDYDAPLLEAGGRGQKYLLTKRLGTFASQFGHVFAHLTPEHCTATALTEDDHPLSIVPQRGSQGDIVFLFRGEKKPADTVQVMLPDGLVLPVPLTSQRAQWLVRSVNLGGVAELDYCNLCPWAFVDRQMLVVYGPAGAPGLLSIDGAQVSVTVPKSREPLVEKTGELTLVVLNEELVDAAYLGQDGLVLGCDGLDEQGQALARPGWSHRLVVKTDGSVERQKQSVARRPSAPRLAGWRWQPLRDIVNGTSDEYQNIDGPASLEDLNQDYGYGWYRFTVSPAGKARVLAPLAGDRVALFGEGKLVGILGKGPGAEDDPVDLTLDKATVALADNLGRFNYGQYVGKDVKGLADHLYEVRPIRMGKAKIEPCRAPDPFVLDGMVFHRRRGELPNAEALVWKVKPDGRKPMVLDIDEFPHDGVIFVNGEPFALLHHTSGIRRFRFVLRPGENGVTSGNNEIRLALYGPLNAKKANPGKQIRMFQCVTNLTAKGQWAFAKWTVPTTEAFHDVPKSTPAQPSWYCTTFNVSSATTALWLEPRGMSKGQVYLNGHNVGRYWVGTATGKAVPPQKLYYLPEPWLKTDEPNELLLFDEHGKLPTKCRLVYNPMGPYNK